MDCIGYIMGAFFLGVTVAFVIFSFWEDHDDNRRRNRK